jgi:hypothetical protein
MTNMLQNWLDNKKFALNDKPVIQNDGVTKLWQIVAVRNIPKYGIQAGDLGGFVESEKNLSPDGDCWIGPGAKVSGPAQVFGNILVCGTADIRQPFHTGINSVIIGSPVCNMSFETLQPSNSMMPPLYIRPARWSGAA